VLHAANGNTDKPENVGAFDTAAAEYSSLLAGSWSSLGCVVCRGKKKKEDRLKSC
jgi:hypothetical protein